MSIDVEYAIKKDLRNNPVVRGVDGKQRRALVRTLGLGGLLVGLVLFSASHYYQIIAASYQVELLAKEYAEAELLNRRLRLEVESLRAPAMVERRAMRELGMVYPTAAETLLIERVRAASAPAAVVAHAR